MPGDVTFNSRTTRRLGIGQLDIVFTQIEQTPNCGLSETSSKFSVGQYLHLLDECQTEPPIVLR